MARKKQPELTFQEHVADYLVRVHKYGVFNRNNHFSFLENGITF